MPLSAATGLLRGSRERADSEDSSPPVIGMDAATGSPSGTGAAAMATGIAGTGASGGAGAAWGATTSTAMAGAVDVGVGAAPFMLMLATPIAPSPTAAAARTPGHHERSAFARGVGATFGTAGGARGFGASEAARGLGTIAGLGRSDFVTGGGTDTGRTLGLAAIGMTTSSNEGCSATPSLAAFSAGVNG